MVSISYLPDPLAPTQTVNVMMLLVVDAAAAATAYVAAVAD